MSCGQYEGKNIADPEVRNLFNPANVRQQPWYQDRLAAKQENDVKYLSDQISYMEEFLKKETHRGEAERLGLKKRLAKVVKELENAKNANYIKLLEGTIGRDSSLKG